MCFLAQNVLVLDVRGLAPKQLYVSDAGLSHLLLKLIQSVPSLFMCKLQRCKRRAICCRFGTLAGSLFLIRKCIFVTTKEPAT